MSVCVVVCAAGEDVVAGLEGCAAYARFGFNDLEVIVVTSDVYMARVALYNSRKRLSVWLFELFGRVDCWC